MSALARVRGAAWPAGITLLVAVGALWPAAALIDLETRAPAPDATLARPIAYVVLAPLSDVMDALTLLSHRQLIALTVTLLLVYAVWRALARRRQPMPLGREVAKGARALVALVAFDVATVLLPRPMAALVLSTPDHLALDVHSHTSASHDGRPGFDAEANRTWHAAAGYQVAFITDHKSFAGANAARARNPARAGDATVLLSGLELIERNDHLLALGMSAADSGALRAELRGEALAAWAHRPALVQTIPERFGPIVVPPGDAQGARGVVAIELMDGAPRGIAQSQRDRALLLRLADSLDLAVVAGSNNHGWGHAAVAWTVMRVPGWRPLAPDSLAGVIVDALRTGRRHAARVFARRSPDADRGVAALLITLPAAAWNIARTMSVGERVSWLAWAWGLWLLAWAARRLAAARGSAPR